MLSHSRTGNGSTEAVIKTCILAFPSLWVSSSKLSLAAHRVLLLVLLGRSFLVYHLFCDFSPSSFCVLKFPSICGLQGVSAPCLVVFFMCPDLSLPLRSPVCECLLLGCFLSVLTCCFLCGLQDVSAPCSVAFFPCPDLFLCDLQDVSSLAPSRSLYFCVLTYPSLWGLQLVSAPCSVTSVHVLICPSLGCL